MTTALSQCSVVKNLRFGRLVTIWTFENKTLNLTLFVMSLDISVSLKKKERKQIIICLQIKDGCILYSITGASTLPNQLGIGVVINTYLKLYKHKGVSQN